MKMQDVSSLETAAGLTDWCQSESPLNVGLYGSLVLAVDLHGSSLNS